MTLKFGTDGIRGLANTELTPELSLAIGEAAARVISEPGSTFLVGRDTRRSGPMIQAALTAGLTSAGANVVNLGVLPTPAVAYISASRDVPAAMISASHNPFPDNGIKFFLPGGRKLSDEVEERLEAELRAPRIDRPTGAGVGQLANDIDAVRTYEDHLEGSIDGDLSGLHIVLDCANGAASGIAPTVFTELGAVVTVINNEPNGENINSDCGSTHPQGMQTAVVECQADMGFAFDGDADRVLAADHTGAMVDGDPILGMLAVDAKRRGHLKDDTLVITVMANLGLKLAMKREGVHVHETKVGDRYVLEALEANRWSLGGEQSGHVIIPQFATTGDGVLTALQVASLVQTTGRRLHDHASIMKKLPQVLRNVRVANRDALEDAAAVWEEVAAAAAELGENGRVLLRPSGTEPLVRVMVEAPTQDEADAICARLCETVQRELV